MKEITIAGVTVSVNTPYSAGHVLNDAEARTLNQVRCENLRNNLASVVKKELPDNGDEEPSDETLEKIGDIVAKYDSEYTFSLPGTGGGMRVTDPVDREAITIAKQLVGVLLREQGIKAKDYEGYDDKIAEVAAMDKVRTEAKNNVAAKEKQKAAILSEIGTL